MNRQIPKKYMEESSASLSHKANMSPSCPDVQSLRFKLP